MCNNIGKSILEFPVIGFILWIDNINKNAIVLEEYFLCFVYYINNSSHWYLYNSLLIRHSPWYLFVSHVYIIYSKNLWRRCKPMPKMRSGSTCLLCTRIYYTLFISNLHWTISIENRIPKNTSTRMYLPI